MKTKPVWASLLQLLFSTFSVHKTWKTINLLTSRATMTGLKSYVHPKEHTKNNKKKYPVLLVKNQTRMLAFCILLDLTLSKKCRTDATKFHLNAILVTHKKSYLSTWYRHQFLEVNINEIYDWKVTRKRNNFLPLLPCYSTFSK